LLVHGFGGGALETWHKQVSAFAPHFRLVVPDLFWFGQSRPHRQLALDSPSQHAATLIELLDRLQIRRSHIVGVSFGGFVALQLARRYPQRVRRLTLVNPAGLEPTEQERRATSERFDGADDLSSLLVPADERALKAFLDTVFYRRRFMPRFVLRQLLRDEFWQHAEAKRRLCAGMLDELLSEAHLRQIGCATMLLWGRHDPLLLPTIGERMARALPRADLRVLERCAHPPMLERPKQFNEEVLQFLR
jgi:pimeloyl-ACP methyl ester carboxylesterase